MSLTSDDLADIKQLMEAVVSAAIKGQDEQFNKIDQRFEQIDQRFEQIDQRFDKIDKRFEQIDDRLDTIELTQNEILNAVGAELADHETRIQQLEHAAAV
ncbi:MAG: hypothetical protein WBP12_04390 [Candidatus Saccharimonas sp.]